MTPIFTPSDDAPSYFYDCNHVGFQLVPRQQPDLLPNVAPEGLDLAPGQDVLQPNGGDGAVLELDRAGQGQLWEGDVVGDEVLEGSVSFNPEAVEAELGVGRDGQGEETPFDDVFFLNNRSIDNMILDTTINMVDGDDMSSIGAAGTACQ